jgi:hypothetical protein
MRRLSSLDRLAQRAVVALRPTVRHQVRRDRSQRWVNQDLLALQVNLSHLKQSKWIAGR